MPPIFRPTLRPEPGLPVNPEPVAPIIFNPDDFPGRSVTEVAGIGPASTKRLASHNIDNLAKLASMEAAELATVLDVSEVRAMSFIDEARSKLRQPQN